MLTPIDIQKKEFGRSVRGYNVKEVDDFLDKLGKELEEIIKQNYSNKEKIEELDSKLEHYYKLESTLHNAIVVAQETAEEVKRNANKESELIKSSAEKDATRIVEEARYKASRIIAEHEDIYKQAQVFKMRFRSLVEAQLSALEMEDCMQEENEDDKN